MLEHQSITLINDSYDGRVGNCSIAYGDRIYGNLESMAKGLGLTQIQEWICNDCIQMFAQDIQRETGADMEWQPEMDAVWRQEQKMEVEDMER